MIAEHWAVCVPHFCLAGSRCFAHGILIRVSAPGFAKSTAVSACRRSQRFSGGWFCQYRPLGFLPGVPAGVRTYKAAVMRKGSTFTTEKAAMGGANAWGRKEMRHNKISKMLSDARPPFFHAAPAGFLIVPCYSIVSFGDTPSPGAPQRYFEVF